MKIIEATQEWSDRELQPLADYVRRNRGSMAEVCRRLSNLSGVKQHPGNIRQWLFPDYCRRVEPRFGVGLMLLAIWRSIQAEDGAGRARAAKMAKNPSKSAPKKVQKNS